MEDLIEKLKTLSFNSYEAKVYLALLKSHPATGYEVSKISNVPQARAYDTLKALEFRNAVVAVGVKPVTYVPVPINHLLDNWENTFQSSISYLRNTLPSLVQQNIDPILNLQGHEEIMKYALEMINNAKQTILMGSCKIDSHLLHKPLLDAKKRGVKIWLVGYEPYSIEGIKMYCHSSFSHTSHDTDDPTHTGLLLSVDDREGLISISSITDKKRPLQAFATRNPISVLLVKELLIHDILLIAIEERLGPELEQAFGKNMIQLRKQVLEAVDD